MKFSHFSMTNEKFYMQSLNRHDILMDSALYICRSMYKLYEEKKSISINTLLSKCKTRNESCEYYIIFQPKHYTKALHLFVIDIPEHFIASNHTTKLQYCIDNSRLISQLVSICNNKTLLDVALSVRLNSINYVKSFVTHLTFTGFFYEKN